MDVCMYTRVVEVSTCGRLMDKYFIYYTLYHTYCIIKFNPDMIRLNMDRQRGGFQKYDYRSIEEKDVVIALSKDVAPKSRSIVYYKKIELCWNW